jgi:Ca-activated chloride channel family protein
MIAHDYGILSPSNLLTVLLLLIILILDRRAVRLRKAARSTLGLPPISSSLTRQIIGVVTVIGLIIAVCRPFWGSEDIETDNSGSDVLFLVDISRSMYAQDMPPSRIELAKRKMKDMIQSLSNNGNAARFGITVFAGDGYTVCPVTTDRGVLSQFIDIISPDLVTSLGSNLEAGIFAGLNRFDEAALKHSRVILISDGEDNFFDQTTLIKSIREKGVRIDALGIGTTTGASITLPNGATIVDSTRRPVVTVLNENSLKAIAAAGGGVYVHATLDDGDVQQLSQAATFAGIGSANSRSQIRTYRELGPWLSLFALLTLLLSAISRRTNPLLIIPIFISAMHAKNLAAETPAPSNEPLALLTDSPYQSYRKGDYKMAVEEYSQALKGTPNDRSLLFGLASSLYRLGRHEESAKAFSQLAETAKSGRDFFDSTYNEGNSLLSLGRYTDAIDAYWRALDVKPDDPSALHNIAVARALLEEQKRHTSTPTPTPTPTPSSESSPQSNPSPSPDTSPSQSGNSQNDGEQGPSPTPGPSQAPTANSDEKLTPAPSPSTNTPPAATASAIASGAPATAEPSPSPDKQGATPAPTTNPSERLKESLKPEESQPNAPLSSPAPVTTAAITEAEAWLESLPDSPLLIRKYRGTPSSGGQTW